MPATAAPSKPTTLTHKEGRTGVPRPPAHSPGIPLLTSIKGILNRPHQFYLEGYRTFGPVFRIPFGVTDLVILAGAEANIWMREVDGDLISTEGNYDHFSTVLGARKNANQTNVEGARHKELRSHMQGLFAQKFLRERIDLAFSSTIDHLATVATGEPIDAATFAKHLVYRQLGMTMANAAPPEYFDDFQFLLDELIKTVLFPWRKYYPPGRKCGGR